MTKYTIPWLTKAFTGIDIPYPVPPYDVLVFLDNQGRAVAINKHAEVIVGPSKNHQEVLSNAVRKTSGGTMVIMSGNYNFTELELSNIVIFASPFTLLNGMIIVRDNVFIYGFPKIKEIDLRRANEYYLEVGI